MKKIIVSTLALGILFSCAEKEKEMNEIEQTPEFEYKVERFADIQILRYKIDEFDKLSLQQKKFAYYLVQAGLSGRDIIYDQNYIHNIEIRDALENILTNYSGEKNENWENFLEYTKQVWFANGIHHHYSMDKFTPKFSQEYFESLMSATDTKLSEEILASIFDPSKDNKRVNLDASKGLIPGSANNFYGKGVTDEMVINYYDKIIDKNDNQPISYGLNSKMVLNANGEVEEKVWKVGGMYGPALEKVVYWLEKAIGVAENQEQADALKILIKYYQTGDLKLWDEYSIAWAETTEGDIDYINGFIEVYGDAKGYRANYETVVQMKDFKATEIMGVLAHEAQWFEDNSTISPEHKKKEVKGITYNVVNVIGEAGDASPATPIGINLPNAEWIREEHGSKSVSLGNIIHAYTQSSGGSILEEFAYDEEEIARVKKWGALGDNLHTALHEVVGHASGKLNPGVGTPKETLRSYASALEEARADLVGLYYLMDEKLIELGLMETLDVGRAAYDDYIRNGLMTQLRRLNLGDDIEEAHMRNRQLIAAWAFEKGAENKVIEKISRDGKTYFHINDYEALREIFGELLQEIQRIKSEGDYDAGRDLIENYAVKVDPKIHQEVLERSVHLNIAAYSGFINPVLVPIEDKEGNIIDFKIDYSKTFEEQMLDYSKNFHFLKP